MPFYEIGGMIFETTYRGTTKGLDNLRGSGSISPITTDIVVKQQQVTSSEGNPEIQQTSSTFKEDFKEGLQFEADWLKIRAGSTAIGTGVKIGRAAAIVAMADGPLPIGDVIAAGILVAGGVYLLGSGMDWW
jgi:hypothetical protein